MAAVVYGFYSIPRLCRAPINCQITLYNIHYIGQGGTLRSFAIEDHDNIKELGSLPLNGIVRSLAARNSTLYVATQNFSDANGDVRIIDIKDPKRMIDITPKDFAGGSGAELIVRAEGAKLYIVASNAPSEIYDISDPQNPRMRDIGDAADIELPPAQKADINLSPIYSSNVNSVKVCSGYAYTLDARTGLIIYDFRDIENPVRLGILPLPEEQELLDRNERFVVTSCGKMKINIIDTLDNRHPKLVANIIAASRINDLCTSGSHLLITEWTDRVGGGCSLETFDLEKPASPIRIHPSAVNRTNAEQHIAYNCNLFKYRIINEKYFGDFTRNEHGESLLNLIDIKSDRIIGQWSGNGPYDRFMKYTAFRNLVYLLRSYHTSQGDAVNLDLIDMSNPQSPKVLANWNKLRTGSDISIYDGYVFIADGENGLITLKSHR